MAEPLLIFLILYVSVALWPFIFRLTDEDSDVWESIAHGPLFPKLIYRGFQKAWRYT